MRRAAVCAALLICTATPSAAQLSVTHLLSAQAGERLYLQPRDRVAVYSQLTAAYRQDAWSVGVRHEMERTSDDSPLEGRSAAYDAVTQRWAEWREEASLLRVGHFETILGNGLVHRSFELPGVIYDESGSRTRYAASRDVDGVLAETAAGPLAVRAFAGAPTDGTVSPASEAQGALRRAGVLQGGQAELRMPRTLRAGLTFTRFSFGDAPDLHLGSAFAAADLAAATGLAGVAVPATFEYAQRGAGFGDGFALRRGDDTPHAMYASLGVLWRAWSLVAELKDYRGFRLGTNDPPAAVREHSWGLLNRNTHLLDAEGEEGVLVELSGPLGPWSRAVLNLSRADGPPGIRQLVFEEAFAEVTIAPPTDGAWELRGMVADGRDTWDFVGERTGVGLAAQLRLPAALSSEITLEQQRVERVGFSGFRQSYLDLHATLAVTRGGWGTLGLTLTRTTDPVDRPSDLFGEPTAPSALFAGVSLASRVGRSHEVELFAGRRRGGRACISGTCYEVQSLEGAELRVTSRL